MKNETYACLVIRAQGGDAAAFDALVRRYQDRAVGYARSLLRFDLGAAEDAAQEAFVRAWHDLPTLTIPEAFPAWLRRIVFKYCDRIRRRPHFNLVSLDDAYYVAGGPEPAFVLETGECAAVLRRALEALPEREREAAFLYYRDDYDLAEIASFLDVPRTTVKNRLHAARKRLRRELWEMAEQILEREKPSRNDVFVGAVLTRVMQEYLRQMHADPLKADRTLLTQGRDTLETALAVPGPLDWETVLEGYRLLGRQNDPKSKAALLTRYLAQPLDDNHAAWAYFSLSNSLSEARESAGVILTSDAFERWLPGRNPRLSRDWPYVPVAAGVDVPVFEGENNIWLLFLGKSFEFASAWPAVWRGADYFSKVDAALAHAKGTPDLLVRFICLRIASTLCDVSGDIDHGRQYLAQMYALAEEADSDTDKAFWRVKAIGHDIRLRIATKDEQGAREKAGEFGELLTQFESAPWLRSQQHELAYHLERLGQYLAVLNLFDALAASGGQFCGYADLLHAGTVWRVSHDRPRALSLLRTACARDNADFISDFLTKPAFADVRDDPEFLAAVQKPE